MDGRRYNGDVGKGFVFLAWSIASNVLILAPLAGLFLLDDDSLALLGVDSRLVGYTVAAVDVYRSAKRKNEERGYGELPGSETQEHSMLDIGLGKHGEIFVAFRHTF